MAQMAPEPLTKLWGKSQTKAFTNIFSEAKIAEMVNSNQLKENDITAQVSRILASTRDAHASELSFEEPKSMLSDNWKKFWMQVNVAIGKSQQRMIVQFWSRVKDIALPELCKPDLEQVDAVNAAILQGAVFEAEIQSTLAFLTKERRESRCLTSIINAISR